MALAELSVAGPAREHPELLAPPVAEGLAAWRWGEEVTVAPIDPELSDTAAFCAAYRVEPAEAGNCVVVAGRRGDSVRVAACLVPATARVDVNGLVRRRLDARKASFAAVADACEWTAMEYGAITPVGLPADWPVLIDPALLALPAVLVGSGVRGSKLVIPGERLAELPGAQVLEGLGVPAATGPAR